MSMAAGVRRPLTNFNGIPGNVHNALANRPELYNPTSTTWFIQPGIEQKWFALGKTTIFGEYRQDDAGTNPGKFVSSDINFWQAGVVQNIDAAATMPLCRLSASRRRRHEHRRQDNQIGIGSSTGAPITAGTKFSLDTFQEIIVGAKIEF